MSKAFLLIVALCTAVPSLKCQVPVNVDPNPNQPGGLQKFFLVPESALAQIPHQNKIIPIPQNVVSTAPATGAGQSTFNAVQNSQRTPSRATLTPDQAQQAKTQEAFRNQVIESNRKAVVQRQEPIVASNQFTQNPTGQFSQNDQSFDNQQQAHPQSQVLTQVRPQVQPDGFRNVQNQTPTRRIKPQRQKTSQAAIQRPNSIEQGQNQVNQQQFQQPRVHHQQSQQPRVQHQQFQQAQVQHHQQFQQPQVQQQQFQQPQVQQQRFQQPQVQQQQFQQPQVQQQQFSPTQQDQFQQPQQAPVHTQSSPPAQRQTHHDQAQPSTSFISTQPSTESQRRPIDFRSPAIRDEDEIIRHQAENAKYSFATSVNDGINDQQNIRQETRDGLKLSGLYSYSDGFYKRTIHYEADENGYRVVNEESEPIGNGPNGDPAGIAEVATDVGGSSVRYSISGQDFPPHVFTGNNQDASNNFQQI